MCKFVWLSFGGGVLTTVYLCGLSPTPPRQHMSVYILMTNKIVLWWENARRISDGEVKDATTTNLFDLVTAGTSASFSNLSTTEI